MQGPGPWGNTDERWHGTPSRASVKGKPQAIKPASLRSASLPVRAAPKQLSKGESASLSFGAIRRAISALIQSRRSAYIVLGSEIYLGK